MKLPWETDPNDLEANYKRPVLRADVVRLSVKTAAAVAAGVGWRFWILDRTREGAKLVVALGIALLVAGAADLLYMRKHDLEQIFLTTAKSQRAVRTAVTLAGVALLAAGTLAYSR